MEHYNKRMWYNSSKSKTTTTDGVAPRHLFVEGRDDDEYKHIDIENIGKREDIQVAAGGKIYDRGHDNSATTTHSTLQVRFGLTNRNIRQIIIAIVTIIFLSSMLWLDINKSTQVKLLNKQTKHKYLFVGGLQRSMTSTVTKSLGSIDGYSQMEISNMPKSDLMNKKPWELGMGKLKDEDYFFKNSGGVEGKMVQDVYSDSGNYVDFLSTYCATKRTQGDKCFDDHKTKSSLIKTEEDLGDNNVTQIRDRLLQEWEPFWDNSSSIRIEKTPENVFMTRWLQALFGSDNTHFLLLMTHPLLWSLKIDKWVVNSKSTLWTFASRIEAWLETYEHLVEWDVPALKSVAITQVERGFYASDVTSRFNLPFVNSSTKYENQPFLTQGYINGYCQGKIKDNRGDWSKVEQSKYDGSLQRSLIQKYECRANNFGYTFWGLDFHCNAHIDNDAFGYAPSLVYQDLQKIMLYEAPSLHGKHIVVFGHSFKYGKGYGMEKRFTKVIEVFMMMGLTVHFICEECVEQKYSPEGVISHFGKTYKEQVTSMFEYGDECLAEKVVAVVNFFTHIGMKASNHGRWENEVPMPIEDGIEHEFLIEDMKSSYGIHPPVIVISDDVHSERISTVMTQMKSAPDEIKKIQQWILEREMQTYAKSDVIVAVSKEDGAAFAALASSYQRLVGTHDQSATRIVVAPYTARAPTTPIRSFKEREDQLLIVGNPHAIALSSMRWFLTEVWPNLRVMKSNIRFKIVGTKWKQELLHQSGSLSQFTDDDWANIGIDFLDFVEQEDLDNKLFQESKVFLVPHKNATGVSTKIIEALSRGIPVVTNSWGKHGLNLEANTNKSDVLIATDDNDEFIQGIINLLENETVWDNMSKTGLLHAKSNLSEEYIFKAMMSAIEGVVEEV